MIDRFSTFTVLVDKLKRDIRKMLTDRAKRLGADGIEELFIEEDSSGLWSLGIVWTRTISGRCIAVRNLAEKEKKGKNSGK